MYFHERNPKLLIAGVFFFSCEHNFLSGLIVTLSGSFIYIYMDKTLKHKKTIDDKIIVLRSSFPATLLK